MIRRLNPGRAWTLTSRPASQPAWRRLRALAAAILLAALLPVSAPAQQPRAGEYEVKAVYLFNFSKFVGWPPDSILSQGAPFVICVLGKDPFGPALESTLAGETVAGRKVIARRLAQPQQADGCRVLFISSSEEARLKDILAALDKSSTLTVSDIPGFADHGGMIEFVLQNGRVRFEVNLAPAADARLTFSSELLKVALAVRKSAAPGGA